MAPCSTPVWTEGSARARAEQQKPEVGQQDILYRERQEAQPGASRPGSEHTNPSGPIQAWILSQLLCVCSQMSPHPLSILPRRLWRKKHTTSYPFLFTLLFSTAILSFNMLHIYLYMYGLPPLTRTRGPRSRDFNFVHIWPTVGMLQAFIKWMDSWCCFICAWDASYREKCYKRMY